jgi:peptidoglycan/xylan/chitin deacetylase (PgdA/CDA1 family)
VGWTTPAGDWDFGVTAETVFQNVMTSVQDGAIVELHLDGPATAESTAIALPWIVERLQEEGYHFVTISEMAQPCIPETTTG